MFILLFCYVFFFSVLFNRNLIETYQNLTIMSVLNLTLATYSKEITEKVQTMMKQIMDQTNKPDMVGIPL